MSSIIILLFLIPLITKTQCTTFTFVNKCDTTIWPGILTNAGNPQLNPTGFELQTGQARSVPAPPGWSGRFWGRTGCVFDSTGHGSCLTGDCGSNQTECNGSGATPPATLAEFTLLGPASTKDFYDVSLVDGFNLPLIVEPGSRGCSSAGCSVDLNRKCPAELRVGDSDACRSACEAFGKPEFCCSGEHANPNTCRPTFYSEMFKSACPKAYSYAYDDATSIFTCSGGGDYIITFCPESAATSREKASSDSDSASNYNPPKTTTTTTTAAGGESGIEWGDAWLSNIISGDAFSTRFLDKKVSFLVVCIIFLFILQIL